MVGLADIPFVGKFVEIVSDKAVDAVFRSFRYVRYKSLVDQLNSETEKLNIQMDNMSEKIMQEKANGKIIRDHILTWQTNAEEIQRSANELSPSCSCIQRLPIPDPVSRFRIGRNAAKKAMAVIELTGTGEDYLTGEIAHLPPVENLPRPDTAFEEFQSRTDTYQQLYDALVNQDSPLVHGIYGMPGVGKTRMMEKIWEDAMKEKIFDQVVRVNVGNDFNEMKLQDEIAGRLDCKLESQDLERRASQLKNSLRNGGKILLILDDVWTEIRLGHIIGTSFGSSSKGSKILLTSREIDVCLVNSCQHPVEIKLLSPEEALYLFTIIADPHTVQSPSTSFQKGKSQSTKSQSPSTSFQKEKSQSIFVSDEPLVQEVCAECGRLPLLIQAVAKALKGKSRHLWEDARNQLKNGTFERIVGVDPQVYVGIKLSIDYLRDDDAKSCLFLCSMFPEDANIDMEILIMLATSSQLILDGESRIPAMIDYLKTSSLLLDSGEDNETKVHDTIRNVARSIAFTDSYYAFLQVTCDSAYLPNANYHSRRFLRLDAETADVRFSEDLECPYLHSLWLQSNGLPQKFSGGFFRMFVNLSFLMLQNVCIPLEQFSLQQLSNLGTLILLKCDISRTHVSLFPKKLKTLCMWHCDLPWLLDVANLKNLQKLEIQQDGKLVMGSNVISSLSSLEKLHILNGFITNVGEYHPEAIVREITELTHLTSLQFHFDDDDTFQGTNIFSNIDRYNIIVGAPKMSHSQKRVPSTRSIELYGKQSQSWYGLMARAEEVRLHYSKIVELSSICNGHITAFEDLKALYIEECHYMRYLASTSKIRYGLQPATCFSRLAVLKIIRCFELEYLFCNNIAKSLVQLQELSVNDCRSMEAIILNDGKSDGEIINFPRLLSLTILNNVRLASFYAKQNSGSTSSVEPTAQYQPFFHGKVTLPSLEKLDITELASTSVIWGNDFYNDELNNLEYIEVNHCNSLRTMFPPCVASNLTHLKELSVHFCEEMREIIEDGEQVIPDDGILFPELTYLRLYSLPSLTRFYMSRKANTCKVPLRVHQLSSIYLARLPALKSFFHGSDFEFYLPALKVVQVIDCGLSTLFTFSVLRNLKLEYLEVRNCELLKSIVEDLRGDETCSKIITLSQLTAVALENLPNLKSSFHNVNYELQMPVIKKVTVRDCGLLNTVFTRSVFQNLKQLKELSVRNCKLLESIFEDSRTDETLDTSEKIITLNQVSTVYLEGLPKFKSIFYSATYKCYMPALKNVTIIGSGLSVLFTSSVFGQIQKLEQLYVSDCKSLEHIVEEVAGDETSEINDKSIKSIELSSINLVSLPNLKSFSCTLSNVFNMPKLHTLELTDCPQIEYFSSSKTSTLAVSVTIDGCSEEGIEDLNDYIRQNHKRGSYSNDCVGESSYSSQHLGTQSDRIEEEKPQETETDQPHSSV